MTDMSNVLPNVEFGTYSSEWLLFEKHRGSVPRPWQNGTLLLLDLRFNLPEGMEAKMEKSMFDVLSKPALFMTEVFTAGYALGSVWIFVDGLPKTAVEATKMLGNGGRIERARFMTCEINSFANTVLSYEISDEMVIFTHLTEVDGLYNAVTHGIIMKPSRQASIVMMGRDKRSCSACMLRGLPCSCKEDDVKKEFDGWRTHRRTLYDTSPGVEGLFGNSFTQTWLDGSWRVQVGNMPPFSLEILCHQSGPVFDASWLAVIQHEIVSVHPPRSSHKIMPYPAVSSPMAQEETTSSMVLSDCSTGSHSAKSNSPVLKAFSCEECGMQFRRRYDVKRHTTAVHLKRKDCVCPHCDKSFSQSGHLNEHIRVTHSADKAHQCPELDCGKTFGAKSKLDRHVRTVHRNLRMFNCDICGKSYKEKSYLRQHQINRHGDALSPGENVGFGGRRTSVADAFLDEFSNKEFEII